jgi:hypothetical protein
MSPLKQAVSDALLAAEHAHRRDFELRCSSLGVWSVQLDDGTVHERVVVVRAFPIAAPLEAVSILSAEGRELVWIDRLDALPPPQRAALDDALAARDWTVSAVLPLPVSGRCRPIAAQPTLCSRAKRTSVVSVPTP